MDGVPASENYEEDFATKLMIKVRLIWNIYIYIIIYISNIQ